MGPVDIPIVIIFQETFSSWQNNSNEERQNLDGHKASFLQKIQTFK